MLTSTTNIVEVTGSSATDYTFNLPIHKPTDLVVYVSAVVVPSTGGSNPHTVTVAANKQSATIAFNDAPGAVPLKFVRTVAYIQETDLANNSLFDAESLETSLDNIVMQTQQASKLQTAGFGFDPGIAEGDFDSDAETASTLNKTKTQRASKALAFDADGDITVSAENIDAQIAATGASADDAEDAKDAAEAAQALAEAALASFTGIYHGAQTATPSSGVTDGDLWFDTNTGINVMKVYNATGTAWEQLTPSSSNQTAINAVNADEVDIGVVAGLNTEIGLLSVLNTEIGLIGTAGMAHASTGDIKLVADIAANVTKVADIDSDVTAVASLGTNGVDVTTVSNIGTDGADVTTVAGKATEIGRIGTGAMAASIALIGTDAYANASTGDIKLVADNAANVTKVADVDTEVGLLGALDTEIGLLGTSAMAHASTGHIKKVGDAATEVANLGTATVVGYITALNGTNVITHMANLNATNVITHIGNLNASGVLTNIANLNASGVISNIAALNASGVIADIADVADVDAEITLLGTSAMATASTGHLALLGTSAMAHASTGYLKLVGDIDDKVTIVANNISDVDNFADLYQIHDFASTPTTDGGGNAIAEGDMAYDSTANVLKIWNGSAFATVSTVTLLSTDTTPILGGNLDVKDKLITTTTTNGHVAFDKGITEKIGTSTVSGTTVTVDLSTGNFFAMDLEGLSGNVVTFTISNPDATANQVSNFIVKITQGTTTSTRNFTWASVVSNGTNIDWAGGAGPDITTGSDKIDILSFTSYDNGTTWYGAIVGQDFS